MAKLSDAKQAVSEERVCTFAFYRDGKLWYSTAFGEVFPVPISDLGNRMSPDPFGIGEAIDHGLRMLLHGQRRSGRTTAMLDTVQEGDLILVAMTPVKHHLMRVLKDRGFKYVDVAVVDPRSPRDVIDPISTTSRRVVLDHSIFEAWYSYYMDYARLELERTREELDRRYEMRNRKAYENAVQAIGGDIELIGEPDDKR